MQGKLFFKNLPLKCWCNGLAIAMHFFPYSSWMIWLAEIVNNCQISNQGHPLIVWVKKSVKEKPYLPQIYEFNHDLEKHSKRFRWFTLDARGSLWGPEHARTVSRWSADRVGLRPTTSRRKNARETSSPQGTVGFPSCLNASNTRKTPRKRLLRMPRYLPRKKKRPVFSVEWVNVGSG